MNLTTEIKELLNQCHKNKAASADAGLALARHQHECNKVLGYGVDTEAKHRMLDSKNADFKRELLNILLKHTVAMPSSTRPSGGNPALTHQASAVQPSPAPWRQATHDAVAGLEVGISHVIDKDGHAVGGLLVAFGPWQTDQQRVNTRLALYAPELLWEMWLVYNNIEWMLQDSEIYAPNAATKKQLTEMRTALAACLEKAAPGFDPTPDTEGTK